MRVAIVIDVVCLLAGAFFAFGAPGLTSVIASGTLILVATAFSVRASIFAFRAWKRDQQEQAELPEDFHEGDEHLPSPGLIFGPLLVMFCVTTIIGAAFYSGQFSSPDSSTSSMIIEGLNFSVQTVTTVGYGNWTPDRVSLSDQRVLNVKAFSIVLMLDGTALWSILIGMLAAWFTNLQD